MMPFEQSQRDVGHAAQLHVGMAGVTCKHIYIVVLLHAYYFLAASNNSNVIFLPSSKTACHDGSSVHGRQPLCTSVEWCAVGFVYTSILQQIEL